MPAIIFLLAAVGVSVPHESWVTGQVEELLARTQPAHSVFPGTRPYSVHAVLEQMEASGHTDRTADVLKERVREYLEGFEGFGGELEFDSDSVTRVFASPRVSKEFEPFDIFLEITCKAGESREYPDRTWQEWIATDYTRAYVKANLNRFSFLFGRESLKWGASPLSPLLLSGESPPFDMVLASYQADAFQFSSFFTVLNPHGDTSRYLTGHRVECAPVSGLYLGISETVVHGRYGTFPDPYYLNPLVVFYPREWNAERGRANVSIGIDVNYFGSGWGAYGELMVDDYPYEVSSMNEHPKLGWVLGLRALDLLREGEYVLAEYAGVHKWCYGHRVHWQPYTYRGYGIGHPLGNDFDRISITAVEHLGRSVDVEISAEYVRKGEGRITDPYPVDLFDHPYFLTGVVEKTAGLSIGARCFVDPLWAIELTGGVAHIWNHTHLEGASYTQPSVSLKLEKMFK